MNRNILITAYKFKHYIYLSCGLAKFKILVTFHCKQFKIRLFYAKIQKNRSFSSPNDDRSSKGRPEILFESRFNRGT